MIITKFILVSPGILISQYIKMKQENKGILIDFTIYKDEARKQRYINRHKNNENWTKSGFNTAGWWSRWISWHLPTINSNYQDIKNKLISVIYNER
jgi:hypothetical protein